MNKESSLQDSDDNMDLPKSLAQYPVLEQAIV